MQSTAAQTAALINPVHFPLTCTRYLLSLCLVLLVTTGCVTQKMKSDDEVEPVPPSYAKAPAEHGTIAAIANGIATEYGPEYSGFHLLDGSREGLDWRLALIDSAVSSLDIQTYLWYPDNSGRLIMERAIEAAERGVHVRMLIDDLITAGLDPFFIELEARPNIELRLFNPWTSRDNLAARGGEMIAEMERLNSRMHDKMIIVDGRAVVIGGRNIGDHYFGLSSAYNFHDLDLLGFGAIAQQANDMFDHFWNSDWVLSAQYLPGEPDPEYAAEAWATIQLKNRGAEELKSIGVEVRDWSAELDAIQAKLHIGTSEVAYDEATGEALTQNMTGVMRSFMNQAEQELLITNAYVIPAQRGIDWMQEFQDRGVDVRILTNSLASHDVPAVNSHYKKWRDDLINAGVELFEFRADPAIVDIVDIPPVEGEFVGLHTKAAVVDRRWVFVGSMNLDPRSANINSEMGAFVDSPSLAEELAQLMLRDMEPENAWQVLLDEDGDVYWVNSDETVTKQPARDGTQRVMDVILKVVPKEQN